MITVRFIVCRIYIFSSPDILSTIWVCCYSRSLFKSSMKLLAHVKSTAKLCLIAQWNGHLMFKKSTLAAFNMQLVKIPFSGNDGYLNLNLHILVSFMWFHMWNSITCLVWAILHMEVYIYYDILSGQINGLSESTFKWAADIQNYVCFDGSIGKCCSQNNVSPQTIAALGSIQSQNSISSNYIFSIYICWK